MQSIRGKASGFCVPGLVGAEFEQPYADYQFPDTPQIEPYHAASSEAEYGLLDGAVVTARVGRLAVANSVTNMGRLLPAFSEEFAEVGIPYFTHNWPLVAQVAMLPHARSAVEGGVCLFRRRDVLVEIETPSARCSYDVITGKCQEDGPASRSLFDAAMGLRDGEARIEVARPGVGVGQLVDLLRMVCVARALQLPIYCGLPDVEYTQQFAMAFPDAPLLRQEFSDIVRCRCTALIGAMTEMCDRAGVPLVLNYSEAAEPVRRAMAEAVRSVQELLGGHPEPAARRRAVAGSLAMPLVPSILNDYELTVEVLPLAEVRSVRFLAARVKSTPLALVAPAPVPGDDRLDEGLCDHWWEHVDARLMGSLGLKVEWLIGVQDSLSARVSAVGS